jgi:O-antigen ligase
LGGYLVGAYLFSVAAFGLSDVFGLLIIPQILGASLVGYALYDILGTFRVKIPLEIGLYGLLGLWAAFTHFIGPRAGEGLTPGLGTLLKIVVATLACAQLIRTDADLFMALKMFVFSVLFVYYQNAGEIGYLRMAGQITEEDRFAGTLSNANTAAIFSLTIIWATVLLLVRSKRPLSKGLVYFLPVGVSLVIIYYSGSKKGLIGLALLVLFVTRLLYQRQEKTLFRKGIIVLVSAGLIILAGYFIYTSPFFFRMEQLFAGGTNASDISRWDLAREAIGVWLMNWRTFLVGVGFDNFWTYSTLGVYAHSTPLELLASTGLVGCALFMGFLVLIFRKFLRLYRRASGAESKSVYFAIGIFLLIYTFFMVTAVLFDAKEQLPIMGCLAGYGQRQLLLLSQGPEVGSPVAVG